MDNLSTGYEHNIIEFRQNVNFTFINGDIRDYETCKRASTGCQFVSHQAALGSVPRSVDDPITTNSVNISGFLNLLVAARDIGVKRFVYAGSSSMYGDLRKLPKIEEEIGNPLSPYAVTKYVNELYANVFSKTYGMECIGPRYFNVFGRNQDPEGAYPAVIPLWVKLLLAHESPVINGDGSFSRDFTYIDNVLEAKEKALFIGTSKIIKGLSHYYNNDIEVDTILKNSERLFNKNDKKYFSEVFNIAYRNQTNLSELFLALRSSLTKYDREIASIKAGVGQHRAGDIPHSLASIIKAQVVLGYNPRYDARKGLKMTSEWYTRNLRRSN